MCVCVHVYHLYLQVYLPPSLQVLLFIPLDHLREAWRSILVALQLRSHHEPVETEHTDYVEDDPLEETTRAQVLWMKSLTRLRTQVRV